MAHRKRKVADALLDTNFGNEGVVEDNVNVDDSSSSISLRSTNTSKIQSKQKINRNIMIFGLRRTGVAYAATTFGATMMSSVFFFYYVNIYLNRFHVSEAWFQASQIVFLLWNAINDPLFGYVQDNFSFSWVRSRRHSILYGAPFFAASFVLPWIPWGDYSQSTWLAGVQLMISLCFYDTLYTFVLLAQCALFAEISRKQEDRLELIRYTQVASLLGSTSVLICNYFSANLANFQVFQGLCICIAIIAHFSMSYTGRNSETEYDVAQNKENEVTGQDKTLENLKTTSYSWFEQTCHIFKQPSFISFVFVNLCNIFHSTFLSNFSRIICDALIKSDQISLETRSIFYGSLFLLPQILIIVCARLIGRLGYYVVIRYSFFLKIVMGILLYTMGPQWWAIMAFYLIDCASTNAAFSLFNLPLSDIIDADKEKYHRQHPLSSMVFGLNALITKPAVSLAPMLYVNILNRHGYSEENLDPGRKDHLHDTMFQLMVVTPIIIGILQLIIWTRFTIRSSHLTMTKYVES